MRKLRTPALPENLGAEQSRNFFLFDFFRGARETKIVRENFCEVAATADSGGKAERHDLVQSYHALRACHITDFGNRFNLYNKDTKLEPISK